MTGKSQQTYQNNERAWRKGVHMAKQTLQSLQRLF